VPDRDTVKICTPKHLAEMVAKHDRDHADDCGCENGIISTLRIYFAPKISNVYDGPPPYIPPDVLPPRTLDASERKPWLNRRSGETNAKFDYRVCIVATTAEHSSRTVVR
jgi:hypothetical protein